MLSAVETAPSTLPAIQFQFIKIRYDGVMNKTRDLPDAANSMQNVVCFLIMLQFICNV